MWSIRMRSIGQVAEVFCGRIVQPAVAIEDAIKGCAAAHPRLASGREELGPRDEGHELRLAELVGGATGEGARVKLKHIILAVEVTIQSKSKKTLTVIVRNLCACMHACVRRRWSCVWGGWCLFVCVGACVTGVVSDNFLHKETDSLSIRFSPRFQDAQQWFPCI